MKTKHTITITYNARQNIDQTTDKEPFSSHKRQDNIKSITFF